MNSQLENNKNWLIYRDCLLNSTIGVGLFYLKLEWNIGSLQCGLYLYMGLSLIKRYINA